MEVAVVIAVGVLPLGLVKHLHVLAICSTQPPDANTVIDADTVMVTRPIRKQTELQDRNLRETQRSTHGRDFYLAAT